MSNCCLAAGVGASEGAAPAVQYKAEVNNGHTTKPRQLKRCFANMLKGINCATCSFPAALRDG